MRSEDEGITTNAYVKMISANCVRFPFALLLMYRRLHLSPPLDRARAFPWSLGKEKEENKRRNRKRRKKRKTRGERGRGEGGEDKKGLKVVTEGEEDKENKRR